MCKAWQETRAVPIKSFHLELIAAEFLLQSPWRWYDFFWFDWIARDFFLYLHARANLWVSVPGTGEMIYLGNDWLSRVESAYRRAVKTCQFEWENRVAEAGEEWQKIRRALRRLRNSLNPFSRFDFGLLAGLRHARDWQARERR